MTLSRRSALGDTKRARTRPKPRPRDTGPDRATRALCDTRDRGRCVISGKPATNLQHRRARGMGGTLDPAANSPANLLSVEGTGSSGVHGHIESHRVEAVANGWSILRSDRRDPAAIPVLTLDGWETFDDDGNRHPCDPPKGP